MAFNLKRIHLVVDTQRDGDPGGGPGEIVIDAEKRMAVDQHDGQDLGERWFVFMQPGFPRSGEFTMSGPELDRFLEDLVAFRGMIRKIEHVLGDAERNGGERHG